MSAAAVQSRPHSRPGAAAASPSSDHPLTKLPKSRSARDPSPSVRRQSRSTSGKSSGPGTGQGLSKEEKEHSARAAAALQGQGAAMAATIQRVSSTTSQNSGPSPFSNHPSQHSGRSSRSRGEGGRPSSSSGERGMPHPGAEGFRPITPGPEMMRQMSVPVPGDMHRVHSAHDGHYRMYTSSSRPQDPMRMPGESSGSSGRSSSRSGSGDPAFNRNHSMNDGSAPARRSSRRSSGERGMPSVPEKGGGGESGKAPRGAPMVYPQYPYMMPGQPMPMPMGPKVPRGLSSGMPMPYPMPGASGGPRGAPGAPGQPGQMPSLYAQQMQVQMMMQQLGMQPGQMPPHMYPMLKGQIPVSASSSSSELQPGSQQNPNPNQSPDPNSSIGNPGAGEVAKAEGAAVGDQAPGGALAEGAANPGAQDDAAAAAGQQVPGWLALPAPGDVVDPTAADAQGASGGDPGAMVPFYSGGTPEEQATAAAAAAAAGGDAALMNGDAGAMVLYNPESGEPMQVQDESGALVLYQPPPVEQAETISQMLLVIQHLQGEVQSLRWALQQLREDVDTNVQQQQLQGGDGKAALTDGAALDMKDLLVQRDLQQRARLYNASSVREKDSLERLPNDKGELPRKFPHYRRDVVCMPTEIVSYLVEFYDLPQEPADTRLDRVAKFIGIRLS